MEERDFDLPVDDLIKIISSKLGNSNFILLSHKFEGLPERTGLLGDHAILKVTILLDPDQAEEDQTIKQDLTFFAKFFPKYPAPARFAEKTGAFKKEIFVYTLLEEFKKYCKNLVESCVTRCHLSKIDAYLINDNLLEEDFEVVDSRKTFDYDTCISVITSLAKLHASSIIYEEETSRNVFQIFRLGDEFKENFEETFYNDKTDFINRDGIRASIKCILEEIDLFELPEKLASGKNFKETVEKLCDRLYDLVKPSRTYRNVLCHGDCWTSNFLLKHKNGKPSDCKLVDFQCARYAPPSHDLMAVLFLTTTRKFRKENLYKIIGVYYATLEKVLKVGGFDIKLIVPFNDFMHSCEEQKLFAIIQAATYFPLILVRKEAIAEYFSNKELDEVALYNDRFRLVTENIKNDEEYRNRLEESILDFRDYCEYI